MYPDARKFLNDEVSITAMHTKSLKGSKVRSLQDNHTTGVLSGVMALEFLYVVLSSSLSSR